MSEGNRMGIEVESEDEGLRAGRRQTMYEETAHETWPLSFRVPRRVAIALREEYERQRVSGEYGDTFPRNFSLWLRQSFRGLFPDLPWDDPVVVVDDQEGE